jgi:hypothetical protein
MEEVTASHVVTGIGGIVVIAGIVQVFLGVQRRERGPIRSRFRLRTIYPGMIMIVTGALLLGVGPFGAP